MKFILGAYASAPSMVDCDKKIEKEFYELILKNDTLIGGLEILFWDTDIHKFGSNFIINFL